jgi:hypothetical protein
MKAVELEKGLLMHKIIFGMWLSRRIGVCQKFGGVTDTN